MSIEQIVCLVTFVGFMVHVIVMVIHIEVTSKRCEKENERIEAAWWKAKAEWKPGDPPVPPSNRMIMR
jgi:hypothetical protein